MLVENELKKLKILDLSCFKGKSHFKDSGTLSYLIFQPISKYVRMIIGVGNGEYIYFWNCKGFSDESINSITASNFIIIPSLDYVGAKVRVKFNGSCLRQDKITYTHVKIVNIYIVYESKIQKN